MFINIPERDDRKEAEAEGTERVSEVVRITRGKERVYGEGESRCMVISHRSVEAEYDNSKRMCPQLNSLDLSLKLQESGQANNLKSAVMARLRKKDFDIDQFAEWASNAILELGSMKDKERRALEGLDPDLLSYVGLGRSHFSRPPTEIYEEIVIGPCTKRGALMDLDPEPKRDAVAEETEDRVGRLDGSSPGPAEPGTYSERTEENRDNETDFSQNYSVEVETQHLAQINLIGEDNPRTAKATNEEGRGARSLGRTRSWKKEARRISQRVRNIRTRSQGEEGELSSKRQLDFI